MGHPVPVALIVRAEGNRQVSVPYRQETNHNFGSKSKVSFKVNVGEASSTTFLPPS